jgi:hypothetical protein
VLQSVKEVESALTTLRVNQDKLKAQAQVVRVGLNLTKTSQQAYAVGAVDLSAILETQKNSRRQLLEQQQLKSELIKAYVNLYQALGAGVAKGLGEDLKAIGIEPETILYAESFEPEKSLSASSSAKTIKTSTPTSSASIKWDVNLYGLYERSVIPAMWRDLNRRYPALMQDRGLHIMLADTVKGEKKEFTAWYRLAVTGFDSEKEAQALCKEMQAQQQSCSVILQSKNLIQAKSNYSWLW